MCPGGSFLVSRGGSFSDSVEELPQVQVAALLGKHKSWVCRRLQWLDALATEVLEDMRLGLVSSSVARSLTRLPRGNQHELVQAVRTHGLSCRQCDELVSRWSSTQDAVARAALLADPMRYLRSRDEQAQHRDEDPRLGPTANTLRHALLRLERAADSLEKTLRWRAIAALSTDERSLLELLTERVLAGVERVTEQLAVDFAPTRETRCETRQ